MSHAADSLYDCTPFARDRLSKQVFAQTVFSAVVLTFCVLAGAWIIYARLTAAPNVGKAPALPPAVAVVSEVPAAPVTPQAKVTLRATVTPQAAVTAEVSIPKISSAIPPNTRVALLDPAFVGFEAVPFAQSAPLGSDFKSISPAPVEEAENVEPAPMAIVAPAPMAAAPEPVETEPMPVPRPVEVQAPASHAPPGMPGRQIAQQSRTAPLASVRPDTRSFFDKLFGDKTVGSPQPSGPVLAYAAPEDNILGNRRITASTPLPYDRSTAVYDISAHTVYLPNGTRLEAHSGLGGWLDDPHHVNEKMRGATPPNIYELTPREQLFHGVRALRLTPVGGGSVFGRTGLLAHTFMLGPRGDSNGCVSFRDYNSFLRAYQSGEVRRLAVVAHM
jgi:Protein of unknown function (DUF2778)